MPLAAGDIVKLFHKNIHISARVRFFKQLQPEHFVLVRVKAIEVRGEGEGRRKAPHAIVTYPAVLEYGQSIVWEGTTRTKNLVLYDDAAVVADAPGLEDQAFVAHVADNAHVASDSDGDVPAANAVGEQALQGLGKRWGWGPCAIDADAGGDAREINSAALCGDTSRHYLSFVKNWNTQDKLLMWPGSPPKNLRGRCSGCNRIVSSVCNCSRTTWICDRQCFLDHVAKKMKV